MASFESYPEPTPPPSDEVKGHRRLKVILAIAVVVLLAAACLTGIMIWKNGTLTAAHQTDTEALNQSTAGVDDTIFSAVNIPGLPEYGKLYGKTVKQVKAIKGSKLVFASGARKTSARPDDVSSAVSKKIKYVAKATVKGTNGVSIDFYLNKKRKVVAAEYYFDLDALGVASADFSVYAASRKVPASLLRDIGIDNNIVQTTALDVTAMPSAMAERDGERSCSYGGKTGEKLKKVKVTKKAYNKKKHKKVKKTVVKKVQANFMNWSLTQTHKYGASDNSTTRITTVTLY